ncbi:MAG: SET domain-containing protein-lysine N-methyltransferase [Smithella sp.]
MKQSSKKTGQAPKETLAKSSLPTSGRRIQVRQSKIHGRGVYAIRPIKAGDTVLEYKGKIITWRKALALHPHDPSQPNHTFYFHLDDRHVIDGNQNGNWARWINHSCEPNLEAEQDGLRVFLKALRDIDVGEELVFDYALMIEGRKTAKVRKEHACFCGSPTCRGTMLAVKK